MNREIQLQLGSQNIRAFLEGGFLTEGVPNLVLHRHCYPEIHWIFRESAQYRVGQRTLVLQPGDVLLIPAHIFHCCTVGEGGVGRIAFQTDMPWGEMAQRRLSPQVMEQLLPNWQPAHGGTPGLIALLQLLCALFSPDGGDDSRPIQDPSLIVEEFFSRRYHEPVTAADLALALSLSEKQTHRLVRKLTGRTFRQELTARRLEVAEQLMATGQYTLSQIAGYVGYTSYSGFWKACRQSHLNFSLSQSREACCVMPPPEERPDRMTNVSACILD